MNTTSAGRKAATAYRSPRVRNVYENPIRTFLRVCPALLFAKSRTERLTTRKVYEINSIGTRRKSRGSGQPAGLNRLNR